MLLLSMVRPIKHRIYNTYTMDLSCKTTPLPRDSGGFIDDKSLVTMVAITISYKWAIPDNEDTPLWRNNFAFWTINT